VRGRGQFVTVIDVPRSRRVTPPRSTQIDDPPWRLFGAAASLLGVSRAGLMKTLVLWFVRWPGIKLPTRFSEAELEQRAAEIDAASVPGAQLPQ
jgi:hypothetical protein